MLDRLLRAILTVLVGVIVGLGVTLVRSGAVAGFAGDFRRQIIFDQALAFRKGRIGVHTAGHMMAYRGMAAHTVEILPVDSHVNIQRPVRLDQRSVQVAVFNAVTAATIEMT